MAVRLSISLALHFPDVPLLYLLASSVHTYNLLSLEDELKRISFHEIRDPGVDTTDKLHGLRQELANTRTLLSETYLHIYDSVEDFIKKYLNVFGQFSNAFGKTLGGGPSDNAGGIGDRGPPVYQQFRKHEQTTQELYTFLLETFQLLMNTTSVRDSQSSLRQARSGLTLTRLAAVYLPLSLTVGVFGMNLGELNDSGQSVWVFVVTAVVVSALSFLGLTRSARKGFEFLYSKYRYVRFSRD